MPLPILPLIGFLTICPAAVGALATLEDPVLRAALPEFKTIPAATSDELTPAATVDTEQFRRWTRSQGDNGARRYSSLNQITRNNVRKLEVAWTYRSGDGAANIQCTPIVVDGLLYAPTPGRALVAVDAATGVERWRKQMAIPKQIRPQDSPARRGLVCWPGDRENAPRVLFGAGDWIYAVTRRRASRLRNSVKRAARHCPPGRPRAGRFIGTFLSRPA
ncbi:MAG: PQQ-binding-like beta-propeller repeat protein [Opitutaceae bacterium]